MNISLYDEVFDKVQVNNIEALFTSYQVDKKTISGEIFVYYIQGDKTKDETPFISIEQTITDNGVFSGTIITLTPIDFNKEDSVKIETFQFSGEVSTFETWYLFAKGMSFQKLTEAYRRRIEKFYAEIEAACYSNGHSFKSHTTPPSFVKVVVAPIIESVAERMLSYHVQIPDLKTYSPVNGYYRVKVGVKILGGISVPSGDDYSVYYTPLSWGKASGEKVLVRNSGELRQLLINQLQKEDSKQ